MADFNPEHDEDDDTELHLHEGPQEIQQKVLNSVVDKFWEKMLHTGE